VGVLRRQDTVHARYFEVVTTTGSRHEHNIRSNGSDDPAEQPMSIMHCSSHCSDHFKHLRAYTSASRLPHSRLLMRKLPHSVGEYKESHQRRPHLTANTSPKAAISTKTCRVSWEFLSTAYKMSFSTPSTASSSNGHQGICAGKAKSGAAMSEEQAVVGTLWVYGRIIARPIPATARPILVSHPAPRRAMSLSCAWTRLEPFKWNNGKRGGALQRYSTVS
jgi:hypothetical protein